jgi:hypothetical protein
MPEIDSGHEPIITFNLENSKPVDLLDLTGSLAAFGEAYSDYVVRAGYDIEPGNVRLFIREIKTGSIIAALVSMADQASWVLSHFDAAVGFVSRFNQILHYFLLLPSASHEEAPTKREAAQAIAVMEPAAKDGGSNLFFNISGGDVHIHHYHESRYDSQKANAIQNSARRFLGETVPKNEIHQDEILSLFQVRGDVSAKVGDRGIIESISPRPVKLIFTSEEVKRKIVDQPENPFQKLFLVDVEAKATEGKVRLYRIFAVKDVLDRD